jgi:hypothetical protein
MNRFAVVRMLQSGKGEELPEAVRVEPKAMSVPAPLNGESQIRGFFGW